MGKLQHDYNAGRQHLWRKLLNTSVSSNNQLDERTASAKTSSVTTTFLKAQLHKYDAMYSEMRDQKCKYTTGAISH